MKQLPLRMRTLILLFGVFPALSVTPASAADPSLRPPAVPLVTYNPYLSIWSEADRLTDDVTRHWTHHPHPLVSLIRIDGKAYRLMGNEPKGVPAFPQKSVRVWPTRSVYDLDDGHVHVTLTFMTAALPDDLDVLTRPLTYLTWTVRAVDGAQHSVSLYDSTSSALAVNHLTQKVQWGRGTAGSLTLLRVGTEAQPMLETAGDDTRIDWGYAYAAAPTADVHSAIGTGATLSKHFVEHGDLPPGDDAPMPRPVRERQPVLAYAFELGSVGEAPVSRHMMVAYDEVYAINFFGKRLRPYWRRHGATPADMLRTAEHDYARLVKRCAAFDHDLMADLTRQGGRRYAQMAALAYRQCLAATGIAADANGQPLLFTKENTSNGDIATVDVIFPMEPMFLFLCPTLAKAALAPVLNYAASGRWRWPCAPHDLGTYPIARGTDDGGEAMPVEESGNVLILCDAIAHIDGNADFAARWWPQLTQWAKFLERYGLDPENQLCTDDFMGHLAHNANLSIKAILGLAAYGDLCRRRGDLKAADHYRKVARTDAEHWIKVAAEGDHSRLAFDRSHTWSQKYNLVWDRVLDLNVFPPDVARREIAFYKKSLQRYGLPLDSRTHLTKTDWTFWVAALAEKPEDFRALIAPTYDYLNATPARMPLVDSYITDNLKSSGMHARPVVGGLFIEMLTDPATWSKWAARDHYKLGNWAPVPARPKISEVVPTSRAHPQTWRYTTRPPAQDWYKTDFDHSPWDAGPAMFGQGVPHVRTPWRTSDIWLRRFLTMPAGAHPHLQFLVFHDEDVEIYVNGVLAARAPGFVTRYEPLEIRPMARALLKPGATVLLAVHCHQTEGGQGIDVGLADVTEP